MFVGETGVDRVVARSCELTKADANGDARAQGGVDLPTLQKYINFWSSSSTDLYGAEISSNSANFFGSSLKGRAWEMKKHTEHTALDQVKELDVFENGRFRKEQVPLRNALNEVLREEFIEDNQKGIEYWNRILAEQGIAERLRLPHRRFNRQIGMYAGHRFDPDGNLLTEEQWQAKRDEWLPSLEDRSYVKSLMKPVTEPGKMAGWIAPPPKGINGMPLDYEYVKG